MKGKIALATALATIVTVGGVYATWTFSEGAVTNASTTIEVGMTGVSTTTEKGTLSVMTRGTNSFSLAVDDADNNHLPDIKKSGEIIVTFTPSATASDDIKTNGIDVQLAFTFKANSADGPATIGDWKYASTQIFEIAADPIHLEGDATLKNADGVFTWVVSASDVGIDLTTAMKSVLVDTYSEYEAFGSELTKGHFVATVSECDDTHELV